MRQRDMREQCLSTRTSDRMQVTQVAPLPTTIQPSMSDAVGKFTWGCPQYRKGKGGGTGENTCKKCGKWGHQKDSDCPAFGKKCRICSKPNHFEAVCYSRDRTRSSSSGKAKASKKKGRKPTGKKAKFQADSVVLWQVDSKGGNSVPSAPTDTEDASKETRNLVLLGPPLEAEHSTMNTFSCCEITSRLDGSSTAQHQVYTDTDP